MPRTASPCNSLEMNDYKKRIASAIGNFERKQMPKPERKKTNDKPEAKFLLELKKHLTSLGFSMSIIEGKANYSESAGRYMHGAVSAGYPDLSGNTPQGVAVFIEVKAPGKRKNIRPEQRAFLIEKIKTNCLAICCDSIEYFDRIWLNWPLLGQKFLMDELPELAPRYLDKDLPDEWFE